MFYLEIIEIMLKLRKKVNALLFEENVLYFTTTSKLCSMWRIVY